MSPSSRSLANTDNRVTRDLRMIELVLLMSIYRSHWKQLPLSLVPKDAGATELVLFADRLQVCQHRTAFRQMVWRQHHCRIRGKTGHHLVN